MALAYSQSVSLHPISTYRSIKHAARVLPPLSPCSPLNPSPSSVVNLRNRSTFLRSQPVHGIITLQQSITQRGNAPAWSFRPLTSPCSHGRASQPGRAARVVRAAEEPDSSSTGPKSPRSGRPWHWLQRLASSWQQIQPLKLLLQGLLLFFLLRLWPLGGKPEGQPENVVVQVPFSEFVKRVKTNEVQTVSIDGLHINFGLRSHSALLANTPEGSENIKVSFSTVRPADYSVPYEVMEKHGVQFSAVDKRGNRLSLLVWILYIVILLSALNRLPIKLPQKGTGRKHKSTDSNVTITFADVAGVDEAKEELQEIVEYLRAPEKFSKLGARPPSGVLLVGPPGTGKTLLAKAVAGEADAPFFSISASEFVELYVGMGAMRVRELFANARKEAPAIVFIDEIDAVAKGRDMRLRSVGNDEREQTLNQLLTELDGFDSDKDNVVICIAATNRPDVLDAALLRPGRFDRRVSVERPDRMGRTQILKVHLEKRNLPLAADVSVETIAGATTGFTGADLANLVNEAALLAGRRNQSQVSRLEFDMAVMRAVAGIEKKRSILGEIEKDVVAKHEVGHALVSTAIARLLPGASEVEKLSIVPRSGGALGFTYIPPKTEDRALMFDSEIRGQLAMLMGGRAAEQLHCSAVSTGAADDIRRATNLAYKAVAELGLSPNIGPLNVAVLMNGGGDDGWLMKDSGNISRLVESDVKQLCEAGLAVALDVIVANRMIHEGLSNLLVKTERLEGDQLQRWLHHVHVPSSLKEFVLNGNIQGLGDSIAAAQSARALVSQDLDDTLEETFIVLDPQTGLPLFRTELDNMKKQELLAATGGEDSPPPPPPTQQQSTPAFSPAV